MQVAYANGTCATCSGRIVKGEQFEWGRERGQRVCAPCVNAEYVDTQIAAQPQREWSTYQTALFEFGVNDTRNGMVVAVAGSGKTTAIEELARRMSAALRIKYLVFNKKNAVEAQQRMPANVEASTFHSACWAALAKALNKPKIDDKKVANIVKQMISYEKFQGWGGALIKLVGLAKNAGVAVLCEDTPQAWYELIDHYGIELPVDEGASEREVNEALAWAAKIASQALKTNNETTHLVDFDDMLYFAVALKVALPQYDAVFVDEAQDTNAVQRAILHMLVKPSGRLIAVGDPRQAIYGFRGADADAMEIIRQEFDCVELPLSINYRCSQAVVEAAHTFCPQLEAWDGAPVGSVSNASLSVGEVLPTDAILCRRNAPLMEMAMRLLRNGIGCRVLGRDIGASLVAFVDKVARKDRSLTLVAFETALEAFVSNEAARLARRSEDSKREALEDKAESIRAIVEGLSGDALVETLVSRIQSLFYDETNGVVTLATIHKAKGLEWPRVFILDRSQMPPRWAKLPWQIEQEYNLLYVAYTRAKVDLRFVEMKEVA